MREENKENINQMNDQFATEEKSSRKNGPVIFETSLNRNSTIINMDNNPSQNYLDAEISWLEQTAFNDSQLFKNKKGHVRI